MRSWFALLALVLSGLAHASANPYLQQGKHRYFDVEFRKALSNLEKALEWEPTTSGEAAEVHAYIGLCRYQLADPEGARAAFNQALSLNRALELPPLTSPKILALFEEERARFPAPPPMPPPPPELLPVADPSPPAFVAGAGSPSPQPEVTAVRNRWPTIVAGGAAAVLAGAGGLFAMKAHQTQTAAGKAPFADEHVRLMNDANREARTANVLFGAAVGAAAASVTFFFVF